MNPRAIKPFSWAYVKDRAVQYWLLARFDKPIGILILLWPTLWAIWLASDGKPDSLVVTVFCLGVILMRAAGCVINDYADRNYDVHVERTKLRPITAGKVSPKEAIALFVFLCVIAFFLVLLLNSYTILLSVVGVFLAASYPFMKRYTQLPQAYLGIAFGWAVPMAFTAQTNQIPLIGWILYLTVALWALVYDTMYAMVDKDDDLKIGIKSTAILFGNYDKIIIAVLQLIVIALLLSVGFLKNLNIPYYLGVLIASALFLYQQSLIAERNRELCFKAFLNSNWFGLCIFIGLLLSYYL